MRTSIPLLSLLVATLIAPLAACTPGGGGNPQEPCCEATGQAAGPTSFAPGELMAQPIAFTTTSLCPSLSIPLSLPDLVELGEAVRVDPVTNRYTVQIDAEGVGQEVLIRFFDTDGDIETNYAVVALAIRPVASDEGITVAPVYLSGPVVSESTLEEGLFCRFRNGDLGQSLGQNMRRGDVRAAISPETHYAFTGEGQTPVVQALANYRHSLNGFADASTDSESQRAEREAAEYAADQLRDQLAQQGFDPIPAARIASLSRYRAIAAINVTFQDSFSVIQHAQTWAQDWNEEIDLGGFTLDTSSGAVRAEYAQNHLLRFTIAERKILDAVAEPSGDLQLDLSVGDPSIQSLLDTLETTLVATTSASEIQTAWVGFADQLAQNIAQQSALPTVSTDTRVLMFNDAIATHNAINRSQPHGEMIRLLYDDAANATPGSWQRLKNAIDTDYAMTLPLEADRRRLTDLLYYPAINSPSY